MDGYKIEIITLTQTVVRGEIVEHPVPVMDHIKHPENIFFGIFVLYM